MTAIGKQILQKLYDDAQAGIICLLFQEYEFGARTQDVLDYLEAQEFIHYILNRDNTFSVEITQKGVDFIENNHENSNHSVINIQSINAPSIIGSQQNATINASAPLSELQNLIQTKPAADQEKLDELLTLLQSLEKSEKPIPRNFFAKVSDVIKKHTDLIVPIGNILVSIFFRTN